ncbi:MAG TPA: PAS domain S-box protein [Verrucomicrobiae bacterium]|jgi:PAS domain S-box-containing protein|nr:PAS domain S-box protein [Verrucomicrobiae bacterium]
MKSNGTRKTDARVKVPVRKRRDYVRDLEKTHETLALQNESLRQTQFELEVSRDHYAEFFDTAPVCFVTLTPSGIIREINLPGVRLLSPQHERLTGWPFMTFISRHDQKVFLAHLARCRENLDPTRPISVELELARHTWQDPTYIELVSIPSVEKESRRVVLKNVFRDITEFKQMMGVHRWLAAIVESTDDAIIGKDLAGRIISCNRGASELYGYPREELVGQPITILSPPELQNEEKKINDRLRLGSKVEHYETMRRRKDGTLVPVSLTISPIRDAGGKIIGASNIARDITERKNYAQKLEASLEREKAANRAKDDFLAALSHELRTPLNPVLLLASDGVRNVDFAPQARMDFDTIRKNIELEARLIDDMLDLTRITRGKLTLDAKPVDIHVALHDATGTVRADVDSKKIELDLKLNVKRPIVCGDAVRLRQIFWNVLKNAVKFTPEGGRIAVETRSLPGDKLVISIVDTGIGMEAKELERVFGAFAQGTHHFGGLGLGLAISRALVELHAGSIHAESAGKGKGATFSIELPVATDLKQCDPPNVSVPPPETRPAKKLPARDIRILLVEDHEPTRESLTHLLSRRNYKVTPVGSLAEARSVAGKKKFNLLISDIGLPDGNGCDLMEEMRKNSHLKGIALTGYGMEQDVSRSYAAGFVAHLTKPVRMESLDDALNVALKGE